MENIQQILSVYDNNPGLNGWLSDYKKQRLDTFKTLSMPTLRDEDWRYTKTSGIAKGDFTKSGTKVSIDAESVKKHFVEGFTNIVFVNGSCNQELSDSVNIDGLTINSLKDLSEESEQKIKAAIEHTHTSYEENYFRALSQSSLSDGIVLSVSRSKALTDKLHLVFVNTGDAADNVSMPSNFIHVEENAEVAILETHVGMGEEYFTNYSTTILVEKNASCKLYKIQNEAKGAYHISHISAALKRDARFETFDFAIGSRLTRNSLEIKLLEEGGNAILDGLYITEDNQHIDNHSTVEHLAAHCESSQFYKGILDGKSRAVFNGRVLVHQDAQKTNAYQLNKNLLLSNQAEIDTKPQLEIDADDVKCSHGATVGQMNDEEIFYLQTRGLDRSAAERLLAYAYSEEIILRISDEKIRDAVNEKLSFKVKGL